MASMRSCCQPHSRPRTVSRNCQTNLSASQGCRTGRGGSPYSKPGHLSVAGGSFLCHLLHSETGRHFSDQSLWPVILSGSYGCSSATSVACSHEWESSWLYCLACGTPSACRGSLRGRSNHWGSRPARAAVCACDMGTTYAFHILTYFLTLNFLCCAFLSAMMFVIGNSLETHSPVTAICLPFLPHLSRGNLTISLVQDAICDVWPEAQKRLASDISVLLTDSGFGAVSAIRHTVPGETPTYQAASSLTSLWHGDSCPVHWQASFVTISPRILPLETGCRNKFTLQAKFRSC